MPTPEEGPSGFRADDDRTAGFRAESESASGGHMSSVGRPSGSLFDTGGTPLPSDIERERHREQTPVPPPEVFPPVRRSSRAVDARQVRRRPRGKRRVRRTIRSLDPWSVLKVSFLFYLVMFGIWLVFVVFLYSVLDGLGLFDAIDNINEGLVLDAQLDVTLGLVMRWAILLGIVFVVVGSIVNTLIALVYNGIARLVGGVELTFIERD